MKFRDFLLVVGVILFLLVFTLLGNSSFSKLTGFFVEASSGSDDFLETSSELLNGTGNFSEGLNESSVGEANESFNEGYFTLMGGEGVGEQDFVAQGGPTGYFVFQINISSNGQTFGFVTDNAVNLSVLWGDGTNNTYSGTGTRAHSYSAAGIYNVSLNGQVSRIAFYGASATPTLLKDVLTNMSDGLTGITSASEMFRGCTGITTFTEPAFFDDVSGNVTTLAAMFQGASKFNGDISNWNTSKVNSLSYMFRNCASFNQPLNSWNTSKVTNMANMFNGASSFNQPLNSWDTSSVLTMSNMFQGATSFNQDLDNWDISKVTTVGYMFAQATDFNGNVSTWNTQSVTLMNSVFQGATSFNQPLNSWKTSEVITIAYISWGKSI